MHWYVYILECQDGSFYAGLTKDLEERFKRHCADKGGVYTRGRKVNKLLYHEIFKTRTEAYRRETQIKQWSREKKSALIAGDYSKLTLISKSRD